MPIITSSLCCTPLGAELVPSKPTGANEEPPANKPLANHSLSLPTRVTSSVELPSTLSVYVSADTNIPDIPTVCSAVPLALSLVSG